MIEPVKYQIEVKVSHDILDGISVETTVQGLQYDGRTREAIVAALRKAADEVERHDSYVDASTGSLVSPGPPSNVVAHPRGAGRPLPGDPVDPALVRTAADFYRRASSGEIGWFYGTAKRTDGMIYSFRFLPEARSMNVFEGIGMLEAIKQEFMDYVFSDTDGSQKEPA